MKGCLGGARSRCGFGPCPSQISRAETRRPPPRHAPDSSALETAPRRLAARGASSAASRRGQALEPLGGGGAPDSRSTVAHARSSWSACISRDEAPPTALQGGWARAAVDCFETGSRRSSPASLGAAEGYVSARARDHTHGPAEATLEAVTGATHHQI